MENPYRQIFQAFADAGIRYLVVGGVARSFHGYRRFTADLNILLARDEENLEKMAKRMCQMPRLALDVLVDASLRFEDFDRRKEWKRVWGIAIPVISMDDFAGMHGCPRGQTNRGIDRDYLRRCKATTPEQRLDWLAAALDFVREMERSNPPKHAPQKK